MVERGAGVAPVGVVEAVLEGLGIGIGYDELAATLAKSSTAGMGDVLMQLAADAFETTGATRSDPIDWDGLREQYLPEWRFGGNVEHQKSPYALWGAALTAAGLRPDDASWWRSNDLWQFALAACVIYVRVTADRRHLEIATICNELTERRRS